MLWFRVYEILIYKIMYGGGTAYREEYPQHKTAVNSINK